MSEFLNRFGIPIRKYGPGGQPAMGVPSRPPGPSFMDAMAIDAVGKYGPGPQSLPVQGPPNNTATSMLARPADPNIAMAPPPAMAPQQSAATPPATSMLARPADPNIAMVRAQNPGRGAGPAAPPAAPPQDYTGQQVSPDDAMSGVLASRAASTPNASRVAGEGFVPTSEQPGLSDLFGFLSAGGGGPTEVSPDDMGGAFDPMQAALASVAGPAPLPSVGEAGVQSDAQMLENAAQMNAQVPTRSGASTNAMPAPAPAPAAMTPTPAPRADQGRQYSNSGMMWDGANYDSTRGPTDPLTAMLNKMFGVNQNAGAGQDVTGKVSPNNQDGNSIEM